MGKNIFIFSGEEDSFRHILRHFSLDNVLRRIGAERIKTALESLGHSRESLSEFG